MAKKKRPVQLRDDKGRFLSNIFKREVLKSIAASKGFDVSKDNTEKHRKQVDEIIKGAKITDKQLLKQYKENISFFSEMIEIGYDTSTFRNSGQIISDIEKYKGRIYMLTNNVEERVEKATAKLRILRHLQLVKGSTNIQDFSIRLYMYLDGRLVIQLADYHETEELLIEMAGEDSLDIARELPKLFFKPKDVIYYAS